MSNIDKSLGELISSRKTSTRGRGAARGRRGGAKGPVGGISKNTASKATPTTTRGATRAAAAAALTGPTRGPRGNKKILVSGLPLDISESHIKEYFGTKVGPISKVELSYDQHGKPRGIATVIFRQELAQKAVAEHHGVVVDGKPLRVEVVYDASSLPPPQPAKSLSDRVAQPKKETAAKKDKPKKVEVAKKERDGATAGKAGRGKRGRNAGRPKKKTAEELDAEMTDYFGAGGQPAQGNGDAAAPAAAPAADNAMEEEVL